MIQLIDFRKEQKSFISEVNSVLKDRVRELRNTPMVVIIQVGDNPASEKYISNKVCKINKLGCIALTHKYDTDVTTEKLCIDIIKLNNDKNVDGILVQLPLPDTLDKDVIINMIDRKKDIDGLVHTNRILLDDNDDKNHHIVPATALGIFSYAIKFFKNKDFSGRNVLIIGRSDIVGKPLAKLFTNYNATVTLAHSKTKFKMCAGIIDVCDYDIIVVAAGKAKHFSFFSNKNALVFDVGINFDKDNKMVGDVNIECCTSTFGTMYITNVPGGVGQLTTSYVGVNLLLCHALNNKLI